jgi:hypothetical protein
VVATVFSWILLRACLPDGLLLFLFLLPLRLILFVRPIPIAPAIFQLQQRKKEKK